MPKPPSNNSFKPLKPQCQAMALEQRILFDGAAVAAAADQIDDSGAHHAAADSAADHDPVQPEAIANPAATPRHLVVIDSRVENYEQLAAQLPDDVQALIIDDDKDGIAAITQALQQLQDVDSIQILSHGSAGQFNLGSSHITSSNLDSISESLASWKNQLSDTADIQLYGCRIGAGEAGQTLVAELAR